MSRRSGTVGLLLVVLALFFASCGEGSGGTSDGGSAPTTTSTTTPNANASTTTSSRSSPTTQAPSTTRANPLDEAAALFGDWVGALSEGESERAWQLMAPSSQLAFGSFDRFHEMRSGFAEGWGSWVAVEDPTFALEEDEAGRTLLIVSGTIRPEGNVEGREVGVPLVEEGGGLLLSPFEEFGMVAEGLDEESSGSDQPPVPDDSGQGRRIVYDNSKQRVWLVESDGTVADTYLVSGRQGVPAPGGYEVFSKSETAFAGHDDITMTHMVRFAHGQTSTSGFTPSPTTGTDAPSRARRSSAITEAPAASGRAPVTPPPYINGRTSGRRS